MIDVKTKFVSVVILTIESGDLPSFSREATLAVQRRAPLHHGFIEGVVMTNEERTELLIVSQWETRDDWAAAQWDADIGRTIGDLAENASAFRFRSYEPITVVRL